MKIKTLKTKIERHLERVKDEAEREETRGDPE
jgi:hypothetical protein